MSPVVTTSTTLLLELASDSRHARWSEFVSRYRPMMEAYLRTRFPRLDADEVVSETLIALVDALADYHYDPEEKGRFHNYLTGILRHKAQHLLRKEKRQAEMRTALAGDPSSVPCEDAEAKEEESYRQSLVEIALAKFFSDPSVRPQTKEVFRAVAVRGEAPEAVAAAFMIERHAVDQIKARSLARIRKLIAEIEVTDD